MPSSTVVQVEQGDGAVPSCVRSQAVDKCGLSQSLRSMSFAQAWLTVSAVGRWVLTNWHCVPNKVPLGRTHVRRSFALACGSQYGDQRPSRVYRVFLSGAVLQNSLILCSQQLGGTQLLQTTRVRCSSRRTEKCQVKDRNFCIPLTQVPQMLTFCHRCFIPLCVCVCVYTHTIPTCMSILRTCLSAYLVNKDTLFCSRNTVVKTRRSVRIQ